MKNLLVQSRKVKSLLLTLFVVPIIAMFSSCQKQSSNDGGISISQEEILKNSSDFASLLGVSENELKNLLTLSRDGKNYAIVPAVSSKSYKDYWCNLVTTNEEYMQTYFFRRKVYSQPSASNQFDNLVKSMWRGKASGVLFFMIILDGNVCGILESSGLNGEGEPRIGYIVEQKFAGQGAATAALEMFVNLVKLLKQRSVYDVSEISLWIFDDNLASQKVAAKNNFVYAEDDPTNKRKRYTLKL